VWQQLALDLKGANQFITMKAFTINFHAGLMARCVVRRKKGKLSTRWETIWHLIFCPLSARAPHAQRKTQPRDEFVQPAPYNNQLGLYSLRAAIKCPHDKMHTRTKKLGSRAPSINLYDGRFVS
jgi:hypothetical protein